MDAGAQQRVGGVSRASTVHGDTFRSRVDASSRTTSSAAPVVARGERGGMAAGRRRSVRCSSCTPDAIVALSADDGKDCLAAPIEDRLAVGPVADRRLARRGDRFRERSSRSAWRTERSAGEREAGATDQRASRLDARPRVRAARRSPRPGASEPRTAPWSGSGVSAERQRACWPSRIAFTSVRPTTSSMA